MVQARLHGCNASNIESWRALLKTGAVPVAGIANSSSEGRPSSLVSRALRILHGSRA